MKLQITENEKHYFSGKKSPGVSSDLKYDHLIEKMVCSIVLHSTVQRWRIQTHETSFTPSSTHEYFPNS